MNADVLWNRHHITERFVNWRSHWFLELNNGFRMSLTLITTSPNISGDVLRNWDQKISLIVPATLFHAYLRRNCRGLRRFISTVIIERGIISPSESTSINRHSGGRRMLSQIDHHIFKTVSSSTPNNFAAITIIINCDDHNIVLSGYGSSSTHPVLCLVLDWIRKEFFV